MRVGIRKGKKEWPFGGKNCELTLTILFNTIEAYYI